MDFEKENMPKHIAIIMDGNRRWAKQRGLPAALGHKKGAKTQKKIEHVYIEIKYKVQDCEMAYKLTYHEGPSNGDSKDYDKIIRATNIDINKINSIIAHHLN